MAKIFFVLVFGLLVSQECSPRGLPDAEDSVVSVYTTQSSTSGGSIDVYHQIANNIAERITSPIYRFLGIARNTTVSTTTKRPWDKIEIFDEAPEDVSKSAVAPVNNDISNEKDVEELSDDALKKTNRKPEKITLYPNYLPVFKEKLELNDTNEIDDSFNLDDVDDSADDEKAKSGPFVFILELLGSFIQLVYGGIVAYFSSNKPSQ